MTYIRDDIETFLDGFGAQEQKLLVQSACDEFDQIRKDKLPVTDLFDDDDEAVLWEYAAGISKYALGDYTLEEIVKESPSLRDDPSVIGAVIAANQNGVSTDDICRQTGLTLDDIETFLGNRVRIEDRDDAERYVTGIINSELGLGFEGNYIFWKGFSYRTCEIVDALYRENGDSWDLNNFDTGRLWTIVQDGAIKRK